MKSNSTSKKLKRKISVHIDTVDFSINGNFPNLGASVVTAKKEGDVIIAEYGNRVRMIGKYGAHSVYVRSMNSGRRLFFQGSPFAFRYGQNIYTSHDVLRGCRIVFKRAMKEFGIEHNLDQIQRWSEGDITLHRVDLAVNFHLDSEFEVLNVLKQIGRQLYEQGRPMSSYSSTVYFKPRDGKDYQIVFYAKGPQMRSLQRYENLPGREMLLEHCESIHRIELRLLSGELKKLKLDKASAWKSDTAEKVFREYMATKLKFLAVTSGSITDDELKKLPSRMRPALALHKLAKDLLPSVFSLRSRQRQARFFRDQGIDICCPNQPIGPITSLANYLSPKRVISDPPQWMKDKGLVPSPSKVSIGDREGQEGDEQKSSCLDMPVSCKTRRFQGKLH